MEILITGADGFLGKNLSVNLAARKLGNIMEFDISSTLDDLISCVKRADFIFHLAGINRPINNEEFYTGNVDLTQNLLKIMEDNKSKAPILFTSSAQVGNGSDYGISKELAEKSLLEFGFKNDSPVFIYRLPGVFGKWSKPNYNTVVATFCHNISRGLDIQIHNPDQEINLCYVDDIINIFIKTMAENKGQEINPQYNITLGKLAKYITSFKECPLEVPETDNLLVKKLHATYLTYLPDDEFSYSLLSHKDDRGSFTEFLHLKRHGQVSINIAKPGIEKGNHWHNTKNEKFLVLQGKANIKLRKLGESKVIEHIVSGDELTVINIAPGYVHNIINIGEKDLITVMWANEIFDPDNPDTYQESVVL